ncbi:MAG: hypothetical protein ABGY42_06575 [bacterium]
MRSLENHTDGYYPESNQPSWLVVGGVRGIDQADYPGWMTGERTTRQFLGLRPC